MSLGQGGRHWRVSGGQPGDPGKHKDPEEWFKPNACGVIALTGLLGVSYQEARERVISERGTHRMVTGLRDEVVIEVALDGGCAMIGHWRPVSSSGIGTHIPWCTSNPTLARWLKSRDNQATRDPWLVRTTRHFLIVYGRKIYDYSTPDDGIDEGDFSRRRLRVKEAYAFARDYVGG